MELKDKLKKLRVEAGLSQEALADLIHVSRSAIAKYENGGGKPSEETLKLIAVYFNVDVNYFNDDVNIEKTNRPKVGLILSLASGSIYIIAIIIATIFYNRMRLTVSFTTSLKAMGMLAIVIASLILVGVTSIIGYLLMTIKTGKKKLIPTLILTIPVVVAVAISITGIAITNVQYNDYKTFTKEKWARDNQKLIKMFLQNVELFSLPNITACSFLPTAYAVINRRNRNACAFTCFSH